MMFKVGCPHSEGKIFFKNYIQKKHLITPGVLSEVDDIAKKADDLLSLESSAEKMMLFFSDLSELDLIHIMNAFIEYFQNNLKIKDGEYPEYQKYTNKRSGFEAGISESLPQLLGITLTDIYAPLMLHVNQGYSIQRVKGLILKSMLTGNADIKQSPAGIINNEVISGSDLTNKSDITFEIKSGSTKKLPEHAYGEPSCPFLLSHQVEEWIDNTIDFLLKKLIPKIQERYSHCSLPREKFYSGNIQKSPSK